MLTRGQDYAHQQPSLTAQKLRRLEIAAVDALIAQQALESEQVRRLLTVPGVNVICAQTFLAAVGDSREGVRLSV